MTVKFFTLTLTLMMSISMLAKTNALTFNMGTIIFGNYELTYERAISTAFSVATIATYYDARHAPVRVFSLGYLMGLGGMLKFQPWGETLRNSVYLAPYMKLGYLVHPQRDNKPADHNILARTGALFGWTYVYDFGLVIDIGWGLENYQFFALDKSPREFQDRQGTMFRPMMALNFGFAW